MRTPKDHPLMFAQTAALMGNLIYSLAKRRKDLGLLDQAERAYLDALDIYQREGEFRQSSAVTANIRQLAESRSELEQQKLKEML